MPELPEVETVRKGLTDLLVNFQISQIEVCRERAIASPGGSSEFTEMMLGLVVGEWTRRGKYLIASLKKPSSHNQLDYTKNVDGGKWGVHLRMTGHFQFHQANYPPCPHTRVRIWNKKGEELRFVDTRSFGQMWWIPPGHSPESVISGLKKLGPEPFSPSFNASYLLKRLQGSKRSIKSALLDQSVVAGAGNIYADETLFAAGINPRQNCGELKDYQLEKLCNSLINVLQTSIGEGGTTFSDFRDLKGLNGNYGGKAWVYRRNNQKCRVCNEVIKKEKIGGRSTHWCPNCQN